MRVVLVDLRNDAEGWIPLEVEYELPSHGQKLNYKIIERHQDLASQSERVARYRGERLAKRLGLRFVPHHL